MKLLLLFALVTVTFWACGDAERPEAVAPGTSGRGGIPSQGGSGGTKGQAGDTGSEGLAGVGGEGGSGDLAQVPTVEIISPAPAGDPSSEEVLVRDEVQVICVVRASEASEAPLVDPSSVSLQMLGSEEEVLAEAAGAPSRIPDQYVTNFVLTTVPTGPVSFRCSASSRSKTSLTAERTISSFVDHGPKIDIQDPLPESVHALAGAVPVKFIVTPEPLASADEGAKVGEVSLEISGRAFALDRISNDPPTFETSIDFTDRSIFPDVLMGSIPVVIRASNQREPTPAFHELIYNFVLDGAPPTIAIKSPVVDAVIGGKQVTLRFSVADALSSVQAESVVVSLNNDKYRYPTEGIWDQAGSDYFFTFDSTQVSGSKWQVTVKIEAKDAAGNLALTSKNFYLDNVPPIVDLDPNGVRERRPNGECSVEFDPLGQAENDGSIVQPAPLLRTFVWDQTNTVGGISVLHYSGIDDKTVRLYIQPDVTAKFLSDETGDGFCDAIASTGLPFQQLKFITSDGTAHFSHLDTPPFGCLRPSSSNNPQRLCDPRVSDLTRVIDHSLSGDEPAIYGVGDLTGVECTGAHWEISAVVQREGWVCLAAEARDKAGNLGVSPPFRVCIDDRQGEAPDCSLASMPSCTDGCLSQRLPPMILAID